MAASMRASIDEARASAVPASATMPRLSVVLALARIEAKQMLRHPAFLLTIAFGLLGRADDLVEQPEAAFRRRGDCFGSGALR